MTLTESPALLSAILLLKVLPILAIAVYFVVQHRLTSLREVYKTDEDWDRLSSGEKREAISLILDVSGRDVPLINSATDYLRRSLDDA